MRDVQLNLSMYLSFQGYEGLKMLLGIHSIDLPGVTIFWVSNKIFFSLFLIDEIGAARSEHVEEPGTIIPFSFGEHLLRSLQIRLFQIDDPMNTKFCLEISRLILGRIIS